MAKGKTSTLTFRIGPALNEALRMAAEREHRSFANTAEALIRACLRAERHRDLQAGCAVRRAFHACRGRRPHLQPLMRVELAVLLEPLRQQSQNQFLGIQAIYMHVIL